MGKRGVVFGLLVLCSLGLVAALETAIRIWPGLDDGIRQRLLTQLDENLKA